MLFIVNCDLQCLSFWLVQSHSILHSVSTIDQLKELIAATGGFLPITADGTSAPEPQAAAAEPAASTVQSSNQTYQIGDVVLAPRLLEGAYLSVDCSSSIEISRATFVPQGQCAKLSSQ